MSLQSNGNSWINGVIGTVASGVVAWVAMVTRQTFGNKGRLDVVEVRLESLGTTIDKMDGKIDRLVDHLLKKEE
jgi:hypothetical protein